MSHNQNLTSQSCTCNCMSQVLGTYVAKQDIDAEMCMCSDCECEEEEGAKYDT